MQATLWQHPCPCQRDCRSGGQTPATGLGFSGPSDGHSGHAASTEEGLSTIQFPKEGSTWLEGAGKARPRQGHLSSEGAKGAAEWRWLLPAAQY